MNTNEQMKKPCASRFQTPLLEITESDNPICAFQKKIFTKVQSIEKILNF